MKKQITDMTNKILVICGDIIDGQRPPNENFNSSDNYDILIHTIIYNCISYFFFIIN